MSKLRVFTLVPLLTVAVLLACTPSATSDIESIVSSDVSVEDAAAATVKAMSIEGAVQATLEAMAPEATETPTPQPIGQAPTPDNQSVSNPTVVINIAATSTVTESTGTVTPTATVVIEVPEPTSTVTSVSVSSLSTPVVQVATPTSIVSASIETVTATAAVIPTIVPSPVAVPTPIPEPTATPTPTPVPLNYNIIEGTTPIGTSGYNYTLQGFSVEDYDLISDLISTQIKWGDSPDYQQVSVMQGTGEILANHTFTSGGAFYGEIRLVSISTGEVLASQTITIVMNLGDIPTAVPTIAVIDVATPTSTVSAGVTPTFTPTIGPSPTPTPTPTVGPTPTPTVTPTPAPTAVPVYDKIVFVDTDNLSGRQGIWIMNSDGSNKTNLTSTWDGNPPVNPKLSPLGNKIVFNGPDAAGPAIVGLPTHDAIWVMDPNGSNRVQLTNPDTFGYGSDRDPSWSPDGTKIVYRGGRRAFTDALQSGIWIMNSDGSDAKRIWQSSDEISQNIPDPVFSPDGTKIAFGKNSDIYVINSDGTNLTQLTENSNPSWTNKPAWSPDVNKITYASSTGTIWVMDADGTNKTDLNVSGRRPRWSPDGTKIIFGNNSPAVSYNGIYVMNADGTNVVQLSNTGKDPHWGPAAP